MEQKDIRALLNAVKSGLYSFGQSRPPRGA